MLAADGIVPDQAALPSRRNWARSCSWNLGLKRASLLESPTTSSASGYGKGEMREWALRVRILKPGGTLVIKASFSSTFE